jgi:hypothetical protein
VAVRDPRFISPSDPPPPGAVEREEWFEREVGEFKMQTKLPCFHDEGTGEWFVRSHHWAKWEEYLVEWFIRNGYTSPEIDAFIREHALSGG